MAAETSRRCTDDGFEVLLSQYDAWHFGGYIVLINGPSHVDIHADDALLVVVWSVCLSTTTRRSSRGYHPLRPHNEQL